MCKKENILNNDFYLVSKIFYIFILLRSYSNKTFKKWFEIVEFFLTLFEWTMFECHTKKEKRNIIFDRNTVY